MHALNLCHELGFGELCYDALHNNICFATAAAAVDSEGQNKYTVPNA